MNSVNFRSLSSFYAQNTNPLLNAIQKKVLFIAGIALLALGLAYVLYTRRCFKANTTPAETSEPEKTDKLAQTKITSDKEKPAGAELKKTSAPAQPKQAKKQEEELDKLDKKEETPKGPTPNPTPTPIPAQQFEGDAFNEEEIDELVDAYVPPEDELSDLTDDAEVEKAKTDEDIVAKPPIVDPKSIVPQPQKSQTNIEILEAKIPTLSIKAVKYDAKPLRGDQMGLPIADYHKSFIDVKKEVRYATRDKTIAEVLKLLLSYDKHQFSKYTGLPKACQLTPALVQFYESMKVHPTCLFRDKLQDSASTQLLGRFDVLVTPLLMSFDAFWKEEDIAKNSAFLMHSAAAINIGDLHDQSDFSDFSTLDPATGAQHLNEHDYLKAMARIFDHILEAQERFVTNAVWFPFGMGANLRNLPKNDLFYKDPQNLYNLRAKIAATFVEAAKLHPKLNIHLCLPTAEPGEEPTQNYNALISALEASKADIAKQFKVYVNVDAASLAQKLANQAKPIGVSLVNGANRNLLGNEWFGDYALRAIDENIHRRSFLAALIALLLNGGTEKRKRTVDELQQRVEDLNKGTIFDF